MIHNEEETPLVVKEFGEDINTDETTKDRIKRLYNKVAVKNWYANIEEFYVMKKMELLMSDELTNSDDKMIKLLNTIASDLWYGWNSKEFIMKSGLPDIWWNDMLGK